MLQPAKLDALLARQQMVEAELASQPSRETYVKLSKEFSDLGPLIETVKTYRATLAEIASAVERPERVVGLHFFNPAPVLQLVEVVRTELASDEAYESAFRFAEALGKEPVRCDDTDVA